MSTPATATRGKPALRARIRSRWYATSPARIAAAVVALGALVVAVQHAAAWLTHVAALVQPGGAP